MQESKDCGGDYLFINLRIHGLWRLNRKDEARISLRTLFTIILDLQLFLILCFEGKKSTMMKFSIASDRQLLFVAVYYCMKIGAENGQLCF